MYHYHYSYYYYYFKKRTLFDVHNDLSCHSTVKILTTQGKNIQRITIELNQFLTDN